MIIDYLSSLNPLKRILLAGGMLFILFLSVLALMLNIEHRRNIDTAKLTGRHQVTLVKTMIEKDLQEVLSDLRTLAGQDNIKQWLEYNKSTRALEEELTHFVINKAKYAQLRLIDRFGKERLRINYKDGQAKAVSDSDLQQKGHRYYFKQAIGLERGGVFVSPLDLNIEADQIEVPYKPVLRFATPVFDSLGSKQGILMLNHLGSSLLDHIERQTSSSDSTLMVVNAQGYWLKHQDPKRLWGFMFDDKQNENFKTDYPLLWPELSYLDQGELLADEGLFSFTTGAINHSSVEGGGPRWKIIYHVPDTVFSQKLYSRALRLAPFFLLLYSLLLVALLKLSKSKEQQYRLNQLLKRQSSSFERFVPDNIVKILGKQDITDVKLGDQVESRMSVMVVAINDFETLSESLAAPQVMSLINDTLGQCGPVVTQHQGFISNFLGERFVALFSDSGDEALAAALSIIELNEDINLRRKDQNLTPVKLSIGIDTDIVQVGVVGDNHRMVSGVVGSQRQFSFALTKRNSLYNTRILISENRYLSLADSGKYALRLIDRMTPHGKQVPMSIYEVYEYAPDNFKEQINQHRSTFERAVIAYQMQRFEQAGQLFEQILEHCQDNVAKYFLQRCYEFKNSNAPISQRDFTQTIRWSNSYSVGVASIDEQHKALIEHINQLLNAVLDSKSQETIVTTIAFLENYIQTHFRDEENIMSEYEYPGLAAHAALHRKFIAELEELKQETREKLNRPIYLAFRIHTMILDWFTGHICKADKQFGIYLGSRLSEAKDHAEAANQAKGAFVAHMSHEIRTPLNAIIGLSHAMVRTQLNSKQQDFMNKIHRSADTLLMLINDVLDFSKIEAERLELEQTAFSLDEIIESVYAIVEYRTSEKNLELLLDARLDTNKQLLGDPLRLRQILTNLVDNAIKFTDTGEVQLTIAEKAATDQNCTLCFSIRDTGIGISEQQQEKLFEAFSQANDSTTRLFGGSGLGLAICRRLVEMMGGELTVESKPGVGSTFSFCLNLSIVNAHPQVSPIPLLQGKTVLVVDDNDIARDNLCWLLQAHQLSVEAVSCGKQAIDKVQQKRFDLLIIDWKMPGMSGVELAYYLNEIENSAKTPKLLLTTSFDQNVLEDLAEEFGVEAVLVKPVLKHILNRNLKERLCDSPEKQISSKDAKLRNKPLFGCKLLLVEDNDINAEVVTELLKTEGVEIDWVDNGVKAIKQIQQRSYDTVLMDVYMPEMDGLEATQQIRALGGEYATIPIFAMTGYASIEDRTKCLDAGMQEHITKPFQPDELIKLLIKYNQLEFIEDTPAYPAPITLEDIEIPMLPGVDIEEGLKRVGGNPKIYLKILSGFLNKQAEVVEHLTELIEQQDFNHAAGLIHTLKGASGNIGAEQIFGLTKVLEQSCSEHDQAACLESLEQLRNPMTQIIEALKNLPPELTAPTDAAIPKATKELTQKQREQTIQQLQKLIDSLHTDFGQVESTLDSLIPLLAPTTYREAVKPLAQAVEHFDTDGATLAAQSLIADLNRAQTVSS